MKKHFSFTIGLFLVIFTSLHCFAASPKDPELSGKLGNGIRTIEVRASRYKFEPDPIAARLGEKVRLVVTSTDVVHGLSIPDYGINISLPEKEAVSAEFVADKAGVFHIFCSIYCGTGHSNMRGTLIVQE